MFNINVLVSYSTWVALIVIPLALSSGALSISAYCISFAPPVSAKIFVMAAVNVVFP